MDRTLDNGHESGPRCGICRAKINEAHLPGCEKRKSMQQIKVIIETTDPKPSYHRDISEVTSRMYKVLEEAGYEKVSVHYKGELPIATCTYCKREAIDNGSLAFYEPAENSRTGEARYYCGCRGWS